MCNFSITQPMIRDTVKRARREKTVPPWIETLTILFPLFSSYFHFHLNCTSPWQCHLSKKAVGNRPYCEEGNGICDEQGRGAMGRTEESVVESLSQGRRLR